MDLLYMAGWNCLMNSVVAAFAVFLIRAVFVLLKKQVIPRIWILVFLAAICPVSLFGLPQNGFLLEVFLGSRVRFYFFLIWEGLAANLVLGSFYRCRKRKWKALESPQLADDVYILGDIKKTMVCGFFHPVIYLPEGLSEEIQKEVLERKRRMIAAGGQKLTVCAVLVTYLFWFNPILWLSRYYLAEDLKRL